MTEAPLAVVPPEQRRVALERRARARRALQVRQAEHSVALFTKLHQPKFREVEHLRELDAALDASMHRKMLIICEAPPRHFKTTRVMNHMARVLRYRPGASVAYCSYAQNFAERRSRNVRELAARAGVWVGELQRTQQRFDPSKAVSFWQTATGGQFVAGGRRGQFVGEGFAFIGCDDLIKDQQESLSQNACDEAWQTFRMLWARLEPGGTMLLTNQRWGEDDPIGRLKRLLAEQPDAPEATIITLPAVRDIQVETDAQGHERIVGGTPLCPWRYGLGEFRELLSIMGEWFWRQYQQDTTPRGRRVFPELTRYTERQRDGAFVIISCDPGLSKQDVNGTATAGTKKKKPDPAGIVVGYAYVGLDKEGKPRVAVDVVHTEEIWLEGMDLLDHLEGLQTHAYPGAPVLLEEVGAFALLSQVGARLNEKLQIHAVTPKGSKFWRAQPAARAAVHSLIRVPETGGEAWVPRFCRRLRLFTGKPGGDDAEVDALTQLYDQAEAYFGIKHDGAMSGGESNLPRESPW